MLAILVVRPERSKSPAHPAASIRTAIGLTVLEGPRIAWAAANPEIAEGTDLTRQWLRLAVCAVAAE